MTNRFVVAFSPVGALSLLVGLVGLVRSARSRNRAAFLLAVAAPCWVWWFYRALIGQDAEFAAAVGAVPVAAFLFECLRERRQYTRWLAGMGIALACVSAWIDIATVAEENKDWRLMDQVLANAIDSLPKSDKPPIVIVENPAHAAMLHRLVAKQHLGIEVFAVESPSIDNQFALWPSYANFVESNLVPDEFFTEQKGINPYIGRNAIYLGSDLPQTIKAAFSSVETLLTLKNKITGTTPLTLYSCLDYQTLPL